MPSNWSCLGGHPAQVGGLGECDCVCLCVCFSLGVCSCVYSGTGMRVGPETTASHGCATHEPCMSGILWADVILNLFTGALESVSQFPLVVTLLQQSCCHCFFVFFLYVQYYFLYFLLVIEHCQNISSAG